MDPNIVAAAVAAASAVSAGLTAGLTDAAKTAVADAYSALKGVLSRNHPSVDLVVVESRPMIESRRTVLAEELAESTVDRDPEYLTAARELVRVIRESAPSAVEVVGVKLERFKAGELNISGVSALGPGASGFLGTDVEIGGKATITDISASQEPPHPR
ncbi:hypothetical protein ACWIGI_40015 [Nocardia sp. NPDC055321]